MDAKDIAEELQNIELAVEHEDPKKSDDSTPEKLLTVSQVNELVKKAKRKGEQKMQEQLDAARQQIEQLQAQQGQQQALQQQQAIPQQMQQAQQQAPQQMQGIDQEQLQQQVMQMLAKKHEEDEARRHHEELEKEVNQVAEQYFGKMAQGKGLYEDFEAMTAEFNPAEFPQLVFLANQSDNTPAIIYELSKNPAKLATLATLVKESPNMARRELEKLSQSIKMNDEAKNNVQEAQNPLNRLKSSPVGADNGTKTVRDYKQASYLKA